MTRGDPYGGPGGDDLWDDAEIATLTFNDTITRVIGTESVDLSGISLIRLISNNNIPILSFFLQVNHYYFQ